MHYLPVVWKLEKRPVHVRAELGQDRSGAVPRAQVEKGQNKCQLKDFYGMPLHTLSYLGEETNKADARAFCRVYEASEGDR